MTTLLTEDKYILDMKENENYISRNSDCNRGGDNITIKISNPKDEFNFISGVDIIITPYIPNQILGKPKILTEIKLEEDFENYNEREGIKISIPVVPEYSYKISGAYKTRFGRLTTSPEVVVPGEFENMMNKVGCYIRNDFVFQEGKKEYTSKESSSEIFNNTKSAITCAAACHDDAECVDGWSYQIATQKCYFYNHFNLDKLQPSTHIMDNEYSIGWATGLKSCDYPGMIH